MFVMFRVVGVGPWLCFIPVQLLTLTFSTVFCLLYDKLFMVAVLINEIWFHDICIFFFLFRYRFYEIFQWIYKIRISAIPCSPPAALYNVIRTRTVAA